MKSTVKNLIILYEDNHIIVINKRAGDITQGDKTQDTPLNEIVKQYLKIKYSKKGNVFLGTIHRLDRPTSGIIIFGKTSKATTRLSKSFLENSIQKTYWAIVKNTPQKKEDKLINYLVKNQKNNKSKAYSKEIIGSKKAILTYKTIQKLDHYYLLEVQLETGRHHQIRCQLAHIGCPIKGDIKYGFKRTNKDASIHLHSRQITFTHPVKKESITIVAPATDNDSIWNSVISSN